MIGLNLIIFVIFHLVCEITSKNVYATVFATKQDMEWKLKFQCQIKHSINVSAIVSPFKGSRVDGSSIRLNVVEPDKG